MNTPVKRAKYAVLVKRVTTHRKGAVGHLYFSVNPYQFCIPSEFKVTATTKTLSAFLLIKPQLKTSLLIKKKKKKIARKGRNSVLLRHLSEERQTKLKTVASFINISITLKYFNTDVQVLFKLSA